MINALFAVDQNGGMGFNGGLPWPHNSEDLENFKRLTQNHIVVMGRRTYDDPKMPKPLKDRITYVVTNRSIANGVLTVKGDIKERVLEIERLNPDKIIWVVGGPGVIEACEDILDHVYLTHFKGSFKIDTRIDLRKVLLNFTPVRAEVSFDQLSTHIKYAPIFRRSKAST
jgi:dihydrofolate reductase